MICLEPPGGKYLIKCKWTTGLRTDKKTYVDKTIDKFGKNFITKAMGFVAQKVISTSFLSQITVLFGTVNPLAFVTGIGINKLIEKCDSSFREESLLAMIREKKDEIDLNNKLLQ